MEQDKVDALKKVSEYLEKYVFYIDTRGYIALKPQATTHYQVLLKALKQGSIPEVTSALPIGGFGLKLEGVSFDNFA